MRKCDILYKLVNWSFVKQEIVGNCETLGARSQT